MNKPDPGHRRGDDEFRFSANVTTELIMSDAMTNWTEIAKLEDIPRLGARVLKTDTMNIALFRTSRDEVFAIKDECPHKQGPLSQGIVHGTSVTCPLHNWKIDLASGEALGPDEGCTNTFATRIEDGRVYLALSVGEAAA
jgi:nitrite reductase (NADH) small subunit